MDSPHNTQRTRRYDIRSYKTSHTRYYWKGCL